MKLSPFVLCLLSSLLLGAAVPKTSRSPRTVQSPQAAHPRVVASDADVEFALKCADSAIRQYAALPEAKKRKLEAQVARAAGEKDVALVSTTMRTLAAQAGRKSLVTKANRAATRTFLNDNPKWCGTVKTVRVAREAMDRLGMSGEMSLDDMLNLIPE